MRTTFGSTLEAMHTNTKTFGSTFEAMHTNTRSSTIETIERAAKREITLFALGLQLGLIRLQLFAPLLQVVLLIFGSLVELFHCNNHLRECLDVALELGNLLWDGAESIACVRHLAKI